MRNSLPFESTPLSISPPTCGCTALVPCDVMCVDVGDVDSHRMVPRSLSIPGPEATNVSMLKPAGEQEKVELDLYGRFKNGRRASN